MQGVVDADCHVIESEAIWEFFDGEMAHRKPSLVEYRDPATGTMRCRWVIGGGLVPHPEGKGSFTGQAPPPKAVRDANGTDWACRSLVDPATRVAHAERMGVEVQVIYPTIFIAYLTDDVELEVALYRAYNRFMADVWSKGENRLRWIGVPPLRNIDATIEEMNFAKQHGAVGVLFRGMEEERSLGDPYFDPVYAEASRLDLPICIHTGAGAPRITESCDSRFTANFAHVRLLPLIAFHDLVHTKVPERFPDLRFGFIESSASWVPFLLHFLKRRTTVRDKKSGDMFGPKLFQDYRFYVACEADEDIPYLLQHVGEDNLIIGSDYGHGDQSSEPQLVEVLQSREDVHPSVVNKILRENPRRLYPIA